MMPNQRPDKNLRQESQKSFIAKFLAALDLTERPRQGDARTETRIAFMSITIVVVVLLLPFINRAFHVDDPLFLWAGKQIQSHPGDPYGFKVNWYGADQDMAFITKNPPLASYYIAAAAATLGWSEPALHFAFFIPALSVAFGMYLIARRYCKRPLLAVFAGVLTPVFFVSSLTVMSDMMMLAFWVFAVYFWMQGLDKHNHSLLALSAVLIAAASLTKYYGMTLVPLLLVYSILKTKRPGWWLFHFLIPAAILAWYHMTTKDLYGRGLLLDAAEYATKTDAGFGKLNLAKIFVNFVFTGGCVASILFFTRQLWSRLALLIGTVFVVVVAYISASIPTLGTFPMPSDEGAHWLIAIQLGVWGTAGISLLILAGWETYKRHDADTVLMILWLLGTFIFAGYVNWTTNGRSILPMIVPAGILIARRLETSAKLKRFFSVPATLVPLAGAAVVAILVAWADGDIANTARVGAHKVHEKYPERTRTIYFQGHWGYQYYMMQLGAKPMDVTRQAFATGDIIANPATNTNIYIMPKEWAKVRETFDIPMNGWLTTMNYGLGAGFYADVWGPLPFALGNMPPERFTIYDFIPH